MSFICGKVYIEWYRTWHSIVITPKCFTYLRYGISTRDFLEWARFGYIWLFCVFYGDLAGPGICPGVFLYMAIFNFEYTSLWKWILLYLLPISHSIWIEKKKIVGLKVCILLRQADVKQKCCKVSVMGKKIIFHSFQLDAWLIIT